MLYFVTLLIVNYFVEELLLEVSSVCFQSMISAEVRKSEGRPSAISTVGGSLFVRPRHILSYFRTTHLGVSGFTSDDVTEWGSFVLISTSSEPEELWSDKSAY